ncbi:MAG: cytidine deaminase [Rikenellaceae bacterium]
MKSLLEHAMQAAQCAYAPYSNFKVGAAIELSDGTIVTGSNQETGSYSLTICAERVALSSLFHRCPSAVIVRMAVYSPNMPDGIPPCGACREYISECAARCGVDIEIIGLPGGGVAKISELMPFAFTLPK